MQRRKKKKGKPLKLTTWPEVGKRGERQKKKENGMGPACKALKIGGLLSGQPRSRVKVSKGERKKYVLPWVFIKGSLERRH